LIHFKIIFVEAGGLAMVSWRTSATGAAAALALTVGGVVGAQPAAADPVDGIPAGCLHGLVICISQDDDTLRLFDHGITKIEMAVRFGAQRTPTRLGTYKVEWKDENHVSKMFDSPMPYSLFFDGGQAIHYSDDFARNGYRGASHGCVNTRDYDAMQQLFNSVTEGTRVVVWSAGSDNGDYTQKPDNAGDTGDYAENPGNAGSPDDYGDYGDPRGPDDD
jgi:hypothetical protein